MGHHQDVDGAAESEAEGDRQEDARHPKLRHDAKRHRERIGENDEVDRSRDVRHVDGDEPRQPQAREPSHDAREALGIERRWQHRCRLVGRIDLRAGEVPDVGDRRKEIARELVDFLQMTAIEQERRPLERRKRGHPLVFEAQRHGNRPALRRMPLQHASDFGQPAVELAGDFCKHRNQPLAVELPHVCRTLPPAFQCGGQLRKPMDQAPPRPAGLPDFVAVDLRTVEQISKTRQHLRGLLPEGLGPHHGFTDGRREVVRGELALRGREPTDGILEGLTAAGRPDQEKDQAVAHDAQRRFLGTRDDCLKIVQRVGAAGKGKERYREPGDVPEIPSRGTRHHVGAEAGEEAHADQEQPAILREQGNERDGRHTPQKGPAQPQQALVQRFSDGRQGAERHGKGGPIGIFPVHGKRDAIGKHHGERGLDRRLDPIRQQSLVRHVCQHAQFERRA